MRTRLAAIVVACFLMAVTACSAARHVRTVGRRSSAGASADEVVYNRVRFETNGVTSAQDGLGCFHSANCAVGNGEIDIQRPT